MKDTYSLEQALSYCGDNAESDVIATALEEAIHNYQWQYQTATEKQYRDAKSTTSRCIETTIQHLMNCGFEALADDVITALEEDGDTLTKGKFLTEAKNLMRRISTGTIPTGRYSREFSELMKQAFIEYCEEYPLEYAPPHIEGDFENQKQLDAYNDSLPHHPDK